MTEMVLVSADLRFELDGVLADIKAGCGVGSVGIATIARVRDALTPNNAEGQALAEVETPASRERLAPFALVDEPYVYVREGSRTFAYVRKDAIAGYRERAEKAEAALNVAVALADQRYSLAHELQAEVKRLRAGIAQLKMARSNYRWQHDLIMAEVEGLREDAARYRAWRMMVLVNTVPYLYLLDSTDAIDRVIDTARKEERS